MAKKKTSEQKQQQLQGQVAVKSHNSDENLTSSPNSLNEQKQEEEEALDSLSDSSSMEKGLKKRPLNEVSDDEKSSETEHENNNVNQVEEDDDDEFLFIRLRKQIKTHWNKIIEAYPNNALFFRPKPAVAVTNDLQSLASENISQASLLVHETGHGLRSSANKSLFLLPSFSCKRDDEGRRTVPLISSLLQVQIIAIFISF